MQVLDIQKNNKPKTPKPKNTKPKKPQKQTNNPPQNAELLSFTSECSKNNIDLCAQAFT